jgi:spore maturation protein CgeB
MKISIFGSSILSSYWNGAATYYRGMVRALHENGHDITFYEPAAYDRQRHADLQSPAWVKVVVYQPSINEADRLLEEASLSDLLIKTSGVGVLDDYLEHAIIQAKRSSNLVAFWDVDAPSTLDRLRDNQQDPFRDLVPHFDLVLTYGGGDPVVVGYEAFGAKACFPIYNGIDPTTHFPVKAEPIYESDLSFLGNRLPDREKRVEEFFFKPVRELSHRRFVLAGNGWADKPFPENIKYFGHLGTCDHNRFYCSALAVLNVCRSSMAAYGFSPATRVFEAAGTGACLLTDAWKGIAEFFEPGKEILIAENGERVVELLNDLTPMRSREIGAAARSRCLREHTYEKRAQQFESIFSFVAR